MAAAAWATNMTTFWLEGATTVTAIGTGGAGLGNPETDFFIQGTDCISKAAWTNATKGFIIDGTGATFTVPTDGGVIFYAKYDAAGSLDVKANGGFQAIIGSANNAYNHYYIGGSDTIEFDSWVAYVIDPNIASSDATTGAPSGVEQWVGILATLPTTSGPTKGNPIAIDAIRYGRCDIEYTAGDGTLGYNDFIEAERFANNSSRRWGLIQLSGGAYLIQGFHSFGTVSTAVDFRDSNRTLYWKASGNNNGVGDSVSSAFNRIEIINASSNVEWDNITIQALGTVARGVFVHTAGALTATNCQFVDMDTFSLLAASVMTTCVFRRCNAITAPGSNLSGSSVIAPTIAADTSSVVWNVATNPSGKLDDTTFEKHGTTLHHAVEFGTSSPLSMTITGMTSVGFNVSNGQNDSTFHVKRTTGTVTINIVGGTGNFSYKTDGATVVIVIDPVTVLVTVRDIKSGTVIPNARVSMTVSSGANFIYKSAITSITQTAGVATVTLTSHGLATNDYVLIEGVTNGENYNGIQQITVTGVNTFTYPCNSGLTSPATGTILGTFAYFNTLTNGSGQVTDTRTLSAAQPVVGSVRRATSGFGTLYKESPLSETVSNTNGLTLNIQMIPDEG